MEIKNQLQDIFGNIDIYLFDQLLKGRFNECTKILDAGCGSGRNLHYFLKNKYEVFGIDQNPVAIAMVKTLSQELSPKNNLDNFYTGGLENINFPDQYFQLIISSAVLHFAGDHSHFRTLLYAMWSKLENGGFLFVRLASDIGIEQLVQSLGEGRYLLPDGSERYLVNLQMLLEYTSELKAQLLEPIKTTNVQNLRAMTTWLLRK